jgi:hypothetical protein
MGLFNSQKIEIQTYHQIGEKRAWISIQVASVFKLKCWSRLTPNLTYRRFHDINAISFTAKLGPLVETVTIFDCPPDLEVAMLKRAKPAKIAYRPCDNN